jgi:hypothetical protein
MAKPPQKEKPHVSSAVAKAEKNLRNVKASYSRSSAARLFSAYRNIALMVAHERRKEIEVLSRVAPSAREELGASRCGGWLIVLPW